MGGGGTDFTRSYDWSDDKKVTGRSARDYAADDDRVHTGYSSEGIAPPVGLGIKTNSKLAAILVVDITGSMRRWPGLIFEKIATFYNEANVAFQGLDLEDLKKGQKVENKLEMAVIAIGDAKGDRHPIQVVDFCKETDLVNNVNKIYPEGRGGGNAKESYDLAAYFITRHCRTPKIPKKAKIPVIIAGDEGFYPKIQKREVKKYFGDDIPGSLDTVDVMKDLAKRFDMYLLRPEESYNAEIYAGIRKQWEGVLGSERVLKMNDPTRLVDDFIMICGYASDNFQTAVDLLERRQIDEDDPEEGLEKVEEVLRTLHPFLGRKTDEEFERLRKKYTK